MSLNGMGVRWVWLLWCLGAAKSRYRGNRGKLAKLHKHAMYPPNMTAEVIAEAVGLCVAAAPEGWSSVSVDAADVRYVPVKGMNADVLIASAATAPTLVVRLESATHASRCRDRSVCERLERLAADAGCGPRMYWSGVSPGVSPRGGRNATVSEAVELASTLDLGAFGGLAACLHDAFATELPAVDDCVDVSLRHAEVWGNASTAALRALISDLLALGRTELTERGVVHNDLHAHNLSLIHI